MIEFDEKKHQYKVNGKVVPSVTEILEHLTAPGYGKVNPSILEEAKERGTAVHELTEDIDLGMPPEYIDPFVEGYIVAYMRFLADYDVEWDFIEHPFYVPLWEYCGTIDRVGKLDGNPCVLDIKTTSSPTADQKIAVCCQTAAYAVGMPGSYDRYALYLHSDGTYDLFYCADFEDERGFDGWELFAELCNLHKRIAEAKKRRRIKKEDSK
jgi:hypothetical protein